MKLKRFLWMAVVLLFVACGQQYNAESLVKDFMNENLADVSTLSNIEFAKIDSTRRLNDSIIYKMREFVDESGKYKQGIQYPEGKADDGLIILRVTYKLAGDDYSDTYYLSRDLSQVIAVKVN